ncbi:hypothetical protein H0H93_005895 [Arthromyces matolae]|nr:hypothetical protein H0H93_005895 [Arthromyces matolae]
MPFNFIRLTKFLLTALVAGQTLHLSLSKAAPTPGVTSDTSVFAQDPVIIDSESTRFSGFNSLSIHGGVAGTQSELDSVAGRRNPVLNRRLEPTTAEDIQLAYFTFERILKKKPLDDEKLVNTLVDNLSDLEQLTRNPHLPDGPVKYAANQYRFAYYTYLKERFERNESISLIPALKLAILFSTGIENLDQMTTSTEVKEEYRKAYMGLLNLLRAKQGDEADHPLPENYFYVDRIVRRFNEISNSQGSRKMEIERETSYLAEADSDMRTTADDRAVAHAYISLYHNLIS